MALYTVLYAASQDATTKQRVQIGMRKEAVLQMAIALQVEPVVAEDTEEQLAAKEVLNALHRAKFDKINNFASSVLYDQGHLETMMTIAIASKDALVANFTDAQLQTQINLIFPLMAGVRNYEV
jgi:hypothetical protein